MAERVCLAVNDLRDVLEGLFEARSQWYQIGLTLSVEVHTLDAIKNQHPGDPREPFQEMLKTYLKTDPLPSWTALIEALRSPIVDQQQLAKKVKQQYCPSLKLLGGSSKLLMESSPIASNAMDRGELDHLARQINISSNGSSTVEEQQQPRDYGCGCGKCSFQYVIKNGCPKPVLSMSSFPYLNVDGLSEFNKLWLRGRLQNEHKKISMAFASLVFKTITSLMTTQNVSVSVLVRLLVGLDAFQPIAVLPQKPLLENRLEELKMVKTIDDVFIILRDYMSFYSHHIVDHIIEELGSSEDKERLKVYKAELNEYCRRGIFECPSFSTVKRDQAVIVFKFEVDDDFVEGCNIQHLQIFHSRIADIIKVSQYPLKLLRVEKGCLQLTYSIPQSIKETLFTLLARNIEEIQAIGVIRISCEDFELIPSESYFQTTMAQRAQLSIKLVEVCKRGQSEIVLDLISRGADPSHRDWRGMTPLHYASENGHLEVVKHLITEQNCNVHRTNKDGQTLLHLACQNGHLEVVKYLLTEQHCNIQCTDKDMQTPLHLACQSGHLEVVKHLLTEQHSNVQCTNKDGQTPLYLACGHDRAEIVHYLLSERLCTVKRDDTTLLNLTDDPSTIRELLRHGANPENVYAKYSSHLPENSPKQPTESAVKIFTVGDYGAGKSTLVKALENEGNWFSGRLTKVKGVEEKTAGIIPHKVESQSFGHVVLYDFAGHKEFYASHAAMLRQSMAGSSTAIFLLLADLRRGDEEFEGSIRSWLSFIDNQCPLDPKPHIIIVGSHVDELKSKDEIAKSNIVNSLADTDAFANFQFKGYISINCCYSQSTSISKLRQQLKEGCDTLRPKSKLSFNTHCFSIYLLDKFRDVEAISLKQVLIKVSENSTPAVTESDHAKLLSFIPTDAPRLCEMCEDLHDRGNILLLRNTEKPEESWIILNQTTLLAKVTGKVFSPEGFKEHEDLASTTGVVPFRKFRDHFPSLHPDMVAQFLCHLEFCQEVTDDEVLKLLQTPTSISCEERVFFFPSLVSIAAPGLGRDRTAHIPAHDSPTEIWKPNSDYVYNSGWVLQCSKAEHHFTPRFLQVLLLRLAFSFALAPHIQEIKTDLQEVQREIYVWKRGICWVTQNGVGALVEIDESGKTVTVLLRCLDRSKVECIHLRSAIIHKALCARETFCPKVSTSEYFIHPDAIEYPLKRTTELNLFSISHITRAIAAGAPCIIGKKSQPLDLEELLYFEPYCHLNATIIQELFDEEKTSHDVDDELMHGMAKCFCNKKDLFFSILKLPDSIVMGEAPHSSAQAIVRLLQLWHLCSRKGSYQCLHRELDHYSVFAGRYPLSPASSSLSAQSTAEIASAVDSTTDNYSTIIDSVDETTLGIESLLEVRTELREGSLAWFNLGLALGLLRHTLESTHSHDIGHNLTETLAAWLQGKDGVAGPTWRAIVKALLSPAISFYRLALQISNAHQCSGSTSMTGNEDPALQDVDNAKLEDSSLVEVKSVLLAGGRHLTWFELGLVLGLYYGTLKVIQSEYFNDDQYLTGTLAAWLKQKDRVPKQGVPSWNSLVRALAHPLVSQQGLAREIAIKHPKVPVVHVPTSAFPTHSLTSPPHLSEHTIVTGNQQEIAKTQDPDTSETQDML